jgi:mono/diheme cytochrome c family protein
MKRLVLIGVLAAVALVFAVPTFAQGNAAEGEKVYAREKCSMCHAIAGKGNAKNPLDGVGSKLKAEEIREWITTPKVAAEKAKSTAKPPMIAKKLSKEDVDNLVAYMESLKK